MNRAAVVASLIVLAGGAFVVMNAVPRASPYDGLDTNGPIVIAGGHFRHASNGSVEFEAYLFNTATHEVESAAPLISLDGTESAAGGPDEGVAETPFSPRGMKETRYFAGRLRPNFEAHVMYASKTNLGAWTYVSECVTMALQPASPEDCKWARMDMSTARFTPANELLWLDYLRSCCEWAPPAFDIFEAGCDWEGADLVCSAGIYNYHRTPATGDLTIRVLSNDTTLFDAVLVSRLELQANASRVFETRFSPTIGQLVALRNQELRIVATSASSEAGRATSSDANVISPFPGETPTGDGVESFSREAMQTLRDPFGLGRHHMNQGEH